VIYRAITTRMRQSDYDQLFDDSDDSDLQARKTREDARPKSHKGQKD
jgi:hypothetical protein